MERDWSTQKKFFVLVLESPVRLALVLVKGVVELSVFILAADWLSTYFVIWGLGAEIPQSLIELTNTKFTIHLLLLFFFLTWGICWSPIDKEWITEPGEFTRAVWYWLSTVRSRL